MVILIAILAVAGIPRLLAGEVRWWLLVGPLATALTAQWPSIPSHAAFGLAAASGIYVVSRELSSCGRRVEAGSLFAIFIVVALLGLAPGVDFERFVFVASALLFLIVGAVAVSGRSNDRLLSLLTLCIALDVLQGGVSGFTAAASSNSVERFFGLFSTAGGPNLAGLACALAMFINLSMRASDRGSWRSLSLPLVAGLTSAAAMFVTLSRRAMLAALIVAALSFVAQRAFRRVLLLGMVLVISLLVTFAAQLAPLLANFSMRWSTSAEDAQYRGGEYELFRALAPWEKVVGGGLQRGYYTFPLPDGTLGDIPVHSSYLFALLTTGILGLGLLAMVLLRGLYFSTIKGLSAPDGADRASAACLIAVLVAAFFGEMFIVGSFSVTVWVALGRVLALHRESKEQATLARSIPRVVEGRRGTHTSPLGLPVPRWFVGGGGGTPFRCVR